MNEGLHVRAGWGDTRGERLSGSLQARLDAAEAQEAREMAAAERARQLAAQEWQSRSEAASVVAAMERGEAVDLREALAVGGHGRTRAEALSYYSALQDAEDAQAAARQAAEFRRWQQAQQAANSADVSAPAAPTARQEAARVEGDRARRDVEVLRRAERRAERTATWAAHRSERRLRGELS